MGDLAVLRDNLLGVNIMVLGCSLPLPVSSGGVVDACSSHVHRSANRPHATNNIQCAECNLATWFSTVLKHASLNALMG
jgi:hypothetical protein